MKKLKIGGHPGFSDIEKKFTSAMRVESNMSKRKRKRYPPRKRAPARSHCGSVCDRE